MAVGQGSCRQIYSVIRILEERIYKGEVMEVILSYLENMFLNMPHTPEVLRAKEELASMMEDKYNELLAEGKKENEAVGIVISEFGDLGELAEELGLGKSGDSTAAGYGENMSYGAAGSQSGNMGYETAGNYGGNAAYEPPVRMVTRQEAEEYIDLSIKTSKWIALGVLLCIWCPIPLIFFGGVDSYVKHMSELSIVLVGLIPLFLMIGIAVALFIYNGTKMEKFDYLKKERIQIDHALEEELSWMAEQEKMSSTKKIIIGVLMCIFSVIPLLITGSLPGDTVLQVMSLIFLLFVVGIAVVLFITGGTRMECLKVLRQEGEFTPREKESKKLIDVIGGIYWSVVTVIYLAWSIVTMQWGFTWIIWPVAGILFGVSASICGVVGTAKKKEM